MTDQQALTQAIKAKEVVVHSVDFDCLLCRCNFDLLSTKKFEPGAFILAHLKSCRLRWSSAA